MKSEPLITVASVTAAVAALIGVLVQFGVDLTDGQQTAILTLVAVLAPVAVALFARSRVTPVTPSDDGYGLVQVLVVIALVLVILFLGSLMFDVSFHGRH